MITANNSFFIRNYTDSVGTPTQSASLRVVYSVFADAEEILTLKCVLDGHIDSKKLTNPNNSRLRNRLEEKLLQDIGYTNTESSDDRWKLRVVGEIMDSLTSGRGITEPYDTRTTYSPNKTTKIDSYKLWFDNSDYDE